MAAGQRKETFSLAGHYKRLTQLCCLCLLLQQDSSASGEIKKMFLNSYVHCGHGDAKEMWHAVDKTTVYNIKDDASPDTGSHTFRACELTFRSTRRDGHLCLQQRHLKFITCDVQLELYDGWANVDGLAEPNKTLNCDHGLRSVEWCTSGRYLTIEMSENGPKPSIRFVEVDLLVYDLQSTQREAFMHNLPWCGSRFSMDHSQVKVKNLDLNHKLEHKFPKCALTFEYTGEEENRSICMVFEAHAQSNPSCSKLNYTLSIFSFLQDQKVLIGTRTCEKPTPTKWCSNSTKLSLELQREIGRVKTTVEEEVVVFTALVLDHEGDAEVLPWFDEESSAPSSEKFEATMAITLSCLIGAVIVSVVIVVLYRQYRYKKRHVEHDSSDGNAETMLPSNGNGHCKNLYTSGATQPLSNGGSENKNKRCMSSII